MNLWQRRLSVSARKIATVRVQSNADACIVGQEVVLYEKETAQQTTEQQPAHNTQSPTASSAIEDQLGSQCQTGNDANRFTGETQTQEKESVLSPPIAKKAKVGLKRKTLPIPRADGEVKARGKKKRTM